MTTAARPRQLASKRKTRRMLTLLEHDPDTSCECCPPLRWIDREPEWDPVTPLWFREHWVLLLAATLGAVMAWIATA